MSTNYIIKILTLGETQVGKTSIVLRYSEDKFNYNKIATIGIDFKIKIIRKGNEKIKVSIYDTAGQERFQNIVKHYYKGANGVLLIYDITKRDTFKKLEFWIEDLKENADNIDNLFIYLIGNKNDMEEKREVSFQEATDFAKDKQLPYIEVSAKTGNNIKKLFDEVIKGAMTKMLTNENKENSVNESIRLSFLDKEEKIPKNSACC
jgi:small GTP-binding protein